MAAKEWDRAHRLEDEALAVAATLGPDGRILSPAALVEALGVPRSAYDYVLRQYADGRAPTGGIHPNGAAARVLIALTRAGDRRFADRHRVEAAA